MSLGYPWGTSLFPYAPRVLPGFPDPGQYLTEPPAPDDRWYPYCFGGTPQSLGLRIKSQWPEGYPGIQGAPGGNGTLAVVREQRTQDAFGTFRNLPQLCGELSGTRCRFPGTSRTFHEPNVNPTKPNTKFPEPNMNPTKPNTKFPEPSGTFRNFPELSGIFLV